MKPRAIRRRTKLRSAGEGYSGVATKIISTTSEQITITETVDVNNPTALLTQTITEGSIVVVTP